MQNTNDQPTKKCPKCGEEILKVAKKCKHCGANFEMESCVSWVILAIVTIIVILIWQYGFSLPMLQLGTEIEVKIIDLNR